MFGRKKKATRALLILSEDGRALYDGDLSGFVMPESEVLRLSVAFFDDPEPCHIHRAAVHNRVCLELCEQCEGKGAVPVSALPANYFSIYEGAHTIRVEIT